MPRPSRTLWLIGPGPSPVRPQAGRPPTHRDGKRRLDALAHWKPMKEWNLPGMAVAVVHGDGVVYLRGFGVREQGKAKAVTPDTVFSIGSLTKAFTAADGAGPAWWTTARRTGMIVFGKHFAGLPPFRPPG